MKQISIEELGSILAQLPTNPRIVASGNFAAPLTTLNAVDQFLPTFTLHMLNAQPGIPHRPGVQHESAFVGPGMRGSSNLTYIPSRLSMVPLVYGTTCIPHVVIIHTSAEKFGALSLGTEVNVLPAAIEAARKNGGIVIAQANTQMPYTFGDAQISTDDIDYVIEVDEPLATHTRTASSSVAQAIGQKIAQEIPDRSTLQLGIGGIPDSVLDSLIEHQGLRIWTEMFSDGVLELHKRGALDPESQLTASFVFGSQELYDWLHLNQSVRMMRTETTNSPAHISQQRRMTSVNAALQVDLFDQANASRINTRIYSGFGGSTDFIVGAMHSEDGRSFMALPSWHDKSNSSTIVPLLDEPVTSFQHSFVVTENGIAQCAGVSQAQQARNLIDQAAHPAARDLLNQAAQQMGLS